MLDLLPLILSVACVAIFVWAVWAACEHRLLDYLIGVVALVAYAGLTIVIASTLCTGLALITVATKAYRQVLYRVHKLWKNSPSPSLNASTESNFHPSTTETTGFPRCLNACPDCQCKKPARNGSIDGVIK